MIRPVKVSALTDNRLAVAFSDGTEGVLDLSSTVGHGIFAPLLDPQVFARVHIGDHGQIAWSEEIEICPDAAYREIAGLAFPEPAHA